MRKQSPSDNVQSVRKWTLVQTCTDLEGLRKSNVILLFVTNTIVTLRSVKPSMRTCEGREGYRWRVGWLGLGTLDTSWKGKRLYRPGIDPRPSGFQTSYPRHSIDRARLHVQYNVHFSLMGDRYNFFTLREAYRECGLKFPYRWRFILRHSGFWHYPTWSMVLAFRSNLLPSSLVRTYCVLSSRRVSRPHSRHIDWLRYWCNVRFVARRRLHFP